MALATKAQLAPAAEHRTANFDVHAATSEIAAAVGQRAEEVRAAVATLWNGGELDPWDSRCRIDVEAGSGRPAGATTIRYLPHSASVLRMTFSGPLDEIMHSVLPHEMTHAVLASIFRRPLPRWIDEGIAILSEHQNAQQRQRLLLRGMLRRKSPRLRTLIAAAEYPRGPGRSETIYLVGFSLTDFLIGRHGRVSVIKCLSATASPSVASDTATSNADLWESAVRQHFPYDSLEDLEQAWKAWLEDSAPAVTASPPAVRERPQRAEASRPAPQVQSSSPYDDPTLSTSA